MLPLTTAALGPKTGWGEADQASPAVVRSYFLAMIGSSAVLVAVLAVVCTIFWTSLISIPLEADPAWYRDYGGRNYPEIADQDLFYQNLGPSIANAKASDIVILGPSFSTYAFDRDGLRAFGATERLSPFNMSFIGIRGGEFSRRVVERWGIHAPLWIINADDQFSHFFSASTDLTLGPRLEPITALELGRVRGFLRVAWRTLRWRYEDWVAERRNGHTSANGLYRNVDNGNVMLDINPRYVATTGNPPLVISRDPDCHVTPDIVAKAKTFLQSIGGQVVLALVPHSQYCPTQARELAKALGVELVLVPPDGFSTVDGGGHLDKRSAALFTEGFTAQLVRTEAFKRAFPDRVTGAANAGPGSSTKP